MQGTSLVAKGRVVVCVVEDERVVVDVDCLKFVLVYTAKHGTFSNVESRTAQPSRIFFRTLMQIYSKETGEEVFLSDEENRTGGCGSTWAKTVKNAVLHYF